jgi:hypothetical protein
MFHRLNVTLVAVTLVGVAVWGTPASAQMVRPVWPSGPRTVMTAVATKASVVGQSMIHGQAIDTNASPLPNASVRLRNLVTSGIEKITSADQFGEFSFVVQPEIPYVVEIADQAGRIIAVGNVVTAQAGEVAAAFIPTPLHLPALAGVFGNTASSVVSSAMSTGLTAIDTNPKPKVSPDR